MRLLESIKRRWKTLASLILIGGLVYFFVPMLFFPSGVWARRVVRDNPLQAALPVDLVKDGVISCPKGDYSLAGVALPQDPALAILADEFLRVATAQGIVVEAVHNGPGVLSMLRCEPRIYHWCGNDPVAAHFQQFNLNELIIAFGYATFEAGKADQMTDLERIRLQRAEAHAKLHRRGMWSEEPTKDRGFRFKSGLDISYAYTGN